jgi:hypothetical protein
VNLLFGKRFEKMAMESADTISDIHGGGSPEAHRVTILRETDVEAKKRLSYIRYWARRMAETPVAPELEIRK